MANIEDYLVICEDESYLLQCYPHINEDKIIQASSWTALNNLQESLVLHDECGTLLDSLFYDGSSLPSGLSLERVDPYSDADVQWHPCEDELGCTPTLANSVLPFTKDLQLNTLSLTMQNNQLKHRIFIENAGLENIDQADLQCFCARNAQEFNLEWENQIEIGDSLDYQFYTDLPEENGYYVYKYFLDAEEDAFLTNNSDYNFYNKDALPIVVNEIMFDPLEEEPEWIEIKQNYFINEIDSLKMKCNEDSFWVVKPENEYFIITSGEEEAEYLNLITPYELGIMTGLPNLANTGEVIKFYDQKDNLLDSLDFNPNWTYGHKGVSTERVNPLLPAQAMNWGPCVNDDGHTLGRKNSIFTQNITSKTKLQVKPNPFSPFQGERTIISFELSEKISRVTIRVFDLKGRLVKVIKNQSLVASKGEIIWDGRDKNNKVLPVGLYIILFEATGIESEKVYSKTKTITIGR
ncbi:MAG: FlgD immunoglobulin-like domain containing protein, partial [Candidatus Cloacimonadota bacterium]|nr:FlgD immunoglobulin-like domain containing protein [Candidatus Cloacimonadota bacterium]